jgi:hypothetical protein
MTLTKIKGLRILGLVAVVALAGGIAVWADSGSGTGTATTAASPAAATGTTEEAAPCGCGGPKSYYLKKYGTIKPPFLETQTEGQPQTPAQATGTVNPASTGNGG